MRRVIGTMFGLALLASGILACGSDSSAPGGTGGAAATGGTGGSAGSAGTGGTGNGGTAGTSTGGTGGTGGTAGAAGTGAGGRAGAGGTGGTVVPSEPYLDDPYYDDPVAFEGAMGYGANAKGGRGDGNPDSTTLLFVDNLNDSGAGSLRAALEASGKRVIVPRVGGYVQINSRLTIENPDYTFLGQLAPGGGLALRPATLPAKHSVFRVSAGNGILRYLTLRASEVGDLSTTPPTYYNQGDAINIGSDATDVIIDHLSAAFATDGIVDISSASRITVQNSLLSFPLEEAGHYEIFHGYATLMTNNSHTSFVYNLISNVRERVPEWGMNPYQQWIHNVVYNYRAGAVIATREQGDTPDVLNTSDFRRNTYKKGPWSNTDKDIRFRNTSGTYGMRCLTYLEGNLSSFITDPSDLEQQKLMARVLSPNPETTPPDPRDVSEWVVSTSIGTPEIRMMTADESYVYVLDHAGNSLVRDSLDEFAVSTVVNGDGLTKMYSSVAEAGGYPAIAGGAYPAAADGVIADAWRTWAGETRAWYELDSAGTKRMVIENYADDIAQGRWSPG